MQSSVVPPKLLGRTGTAVPPMIWEMTEAFVENTSGEEILRACTRYQVNWLLLPQLLSPAVLERMKTTLGGVEDNQRWTIVLGADAESLRSRNARFVEDRLALLGRQKCLAIMLESAAIIDVKSGWPFHRLMHLRDRGLTELFFIEAEDCAAAEWFVEHSPAHAIGLPFGIEDQTARYRLLDMAASVGTALLARSVNSDEDRRFVAAEPGIAALIQPLPESVEGVESILRAMAHPISADERSRHWEQFKQRVPEPPRPRSAHPPEYGA